MNRSSTPTSPTTSRKMQFPGSELLAVYQRAEDLIAIGAYAPGTRVDIDRAISMIDAIHGYLRQDCEESVSFENSVQQLQKLFQADTV